MASLSLDIVISIGNVPGKGIVPGIRLVFRPVNVSPGLALRDVIDLPLEANFSSFTPFRGSGMVNLNCTSRCRTLSPERHLFSR
ncbi:hypothetical protein PHISP_01379 [Aspergillus sp. HF37]|nr:hypothetical protein PHISP_01379 [Aspergillus sp. HF37]